MLLLVSFNIVSFGRDIHTCLCKPEVEKVKHSCCSKKTESNTKSCKKDSNEKSDCDNCKIVKKVNKNEATISESKVIKTEVKVLNTDYTLNLYKSTNSNQDIVLNISTIPKLYLSISSLRI